MAINLLYVELRTLQLLLDPRRPLSLSRACQKCVSEGLDAAVYKERASNQVYFSA